MNVYRVDFGAGRGSNSFWVEAGDLATAYAIAKKRLSRGRRVQFRIMVDRRPPASFGGVYTLVREASA